MPFFVVLNVLKSVIVFRFGDATHLILHGSVPPPPLACVLCATIQDFGHKTSSCKDENMQGAFSVAQKVDVFALPTTCDNVCKNQFPLRISQHSDYLTFTRSTRRVPILILRVPSIIV